ncbi:TonB-dependent receptor [Sphingosinicella sp. LHD-64]|uniref:TonB-dependent receptor n=1 Tax=Sphingosinicella sp. LHD-64 TaxID=3072139 RepID=UPI0035BE634B
MGRLSARSRMIAAMLVTVALPGTAFAQTIAGTVVDSSGTRALQGAEIILVELGRTTQAASDGTFRFADVPPGTYTMRTRYTGAEEVTQSIAVPEAGTVTTSVELGAIEGASILVIGQRANLSSSLARQRASDTVDTVLTRDAIGQFPDQNVAEALRRAPGVNILNDQGEGRFVSVRGLDPNLNAASINGNRVPAPEADVRSVALDVIPTELIESIEIRKSLTPDMDADTIGASIEINTTSAFDRQRGLLALSLEGTYNDLTDRLSPKGSVDFSTRLTDNFGIAGGFSYYRRRFATDNVEMDGWGETDDGIVFADTLEYRDYDVTRQRIGGTLSLDWRPSSTTTLYARGLYSRFEDQEYRRRLIFEMDEDPSSGDSNTATFLSDDGEIQVTRDLKDRFEAQNILSLTTGGETVAGPWTFRYSGAYSWASERENGSIDPIEFRRSFEDPGDLSVTFDYSDTVLPRYTINAGNEAFLDPAEFEFNELSLTSLSDSTDEEWTVRADITRNIPLATGSFDIQFGGKVRLRQKDYDLELDLYDGFDGDFTLADVLGQQNYGLAVIDPVPSFGDARDFFDANRGSFELNPIDTAFESAVADYSVSEDIYAGYLLGRLDTGPLRAVAGVRMEHTRNDINGNFVELVEEGAIRDGVELEEDTVFVSPLNFRRRYTDWLPSINIRYQAARDMLLRLGGYRSIVRPNIGNLAPRFLIEENDEGDREGTFGNPELRPYRAWNLDLSAEYYFARNAVVQAGFFYKSIDDFIVEANFEDITFNGVFADEATIPINGERAEVTGFEFSYQQALTFLPAPLNGLLVNFNYTYTDAEGRLADGELTTGRTIPLPSASRHTFNAVLGYERGPISLRLAGTYRAGYLDEIGGEPDEDRYVRDHFQFDASVRYRINRNFQVFAELVNAFDEPYTAYQRGPGRPRLLQYEEYSWTGKFGVRANF